VAPRAADDRENLPLLGEFLELLRLGARPEVAIFSIHLA